MRYLPISNGCNSVRATLFLILAISFTAFYTINFMNTVRVDDDNLFYVLSAIELTDPQKSASLKTELMATLKKSDLDEREIGREQTRMDYTGNYRAMSFGWLLALSSWDALGSKVFRAHSGDHSARADSTLDVYQFLWIFYICPLVIALVFFAVLALGAHLSALFAMVATIAVIAALALANDEVYRFFTIKYGFWQAINHLWAFVLSMSDHFNIFSYKPRGLFSLLLIGVFYLRWCGSSFASYLLLFFLFSIHQSNAAMILATLVALDLFMRPEKILKFKVGIVIFLSLCLYLARESLWSAVNWAPNVFGLVVLLASAITVYLAAKNLLPLYVRRKNRLFSRLLPHSGSRPVGRAVSDLLLISLFIILSFALVYFIHDQHPFEPFSFRYFWGQIHTRWAALLAPSYVFGLVWIGCLSTKLSHATLAIFVILSSAGSVALLASPQIKTSLNQFGQAIDEGEVLLKKTHAKATQWSEKECIETSMRWEANWYASLILAIQKKVPFPIQTNSAEDHICGY